MRGGGGSHGIAIRIVGILPEEGLWSRNLVTILLLTEGVEDGGEER